MNAHFVAPGELETRHNETPSLPLAARRPGEAPHRALPEVPMRFLSFLLLPLCYASSEAGPVGGPADPLPGGAPPEPPPEPTPSVDPAASVWSSTISIRLDHYANGTSYIELVGERTDGACIHNEVGSPDGKRFEAREVAAALRGGVLAAFLTGPEVEPDFEEA